jgi:hypothetical protein
MKTYFEKASSFKTSSSIDYLVVMNPVVMKPAILILPNLRNYRKFTRTGITRTQKIEE